MRNARQLKDMRVLVGIETVRRIGAKQAMLRAAERRDAAEEALDAAREAAAQAEADWAEQVQVVGHDPAAACWFAERLIHDAAEETEAAVGAQREAQVADRRRQEWQLLDARVRGGERELAKLKRRAANARDEKQTQALADSATFAWRRS